MPESFGERLRRVRESKPGGFFRVLSQGKAAHLFHVSLACYRNWEKGISFPDERSRPRLLELWPEVFAKEFIEPPRE